MFFQSSLFREVHIGADWTRQSGDLRSTMLILGSIAWVGMTLGTEHPGRSIRYGDSKGPDGPGGDVPLNSMLEKRLGGRDDEDCPRVSRARRRHRPCRQSKDGG